MSEIGIYSINELEIIQNQSPEKQRESCMAHASKIAKRINSAINNISEAKKYLEKSKFDTSSDVSNMLTLGILGESSNDKKHKYNSKSQELHMKATQELAEIQQEAIKFSQYTFEIATGMNMALSTIISQGFIENNGKTETLGDTAKKNLETIMKFTQNFIDEHSKHRQEFETLHSKLQEKESIDAQQERAIQNLQSQLQHKTNIDRQQEKSIAKNKQALEAHSQKLKALDSKLQEKESIDLRQEEAINDLSARLKELESMREQQDNIIHEMQGNLAILGKSTSKLSLIFSSLAMIISLVSIALHFVKI